MGVGGGGGGRGGGGGGGRLGAKHAMRRLSVGAGLAQR